jgi:thiamine biosynthesis lipoprotein
LPASQKDARPVHLSGHAQGTTWNITYFNDDTVVTKNDIDSILRSIDSSLSIYKPYSLITTFNNSKRGVVMDNHLKHVVNASLHVSRETHGLSDITVAPLVDAWGFGVKESQSVPDKKKIKSLLRCVGYRKIKVSGDSLIKTKPCIKIDVNGIAQGYSVDILANYIASKGVKDFLVELGGELRVQGHKQPGNQPFKIGVESPSADDFSTLPMQKIVIIDAGAITTSGNYRKYHESKGKKYSHIIDPRTGKSVDNEMISATVYAKYAMSADAYDNALLLMGVKDALQFVKSRPGLEAFIIYKKKDGTIADTASAGFLRLIQ